LNSGGWRRRLTKEAGRDWQRWLAHLENDEPEEGEEIYDKPPKTTW